MKKIIILFTLISSILFSSCSYAMDSRFKVISTMAGYGVVGGALLGTASLAFGTSGRAVAKGASLGLYAGLIFGGYIISSYELKKRGYGQPSKEDYYPESQGPYENSYSPRVPSIEDYQLVSFENKKDPNQDPLISLNLLTLQF